MTVAEYIEALKKLPQSAPCLSTAGDEEELATGPDDTQFYHIYGDGENAVYTWCSGKVANHECGLCKSGRERVQVVRLI